MLRAALVTPSAPESFLETSRSLGLLLDKVRSFGGSIEGRSPTGIAAAFGLDPTEDAPSRAAHAAMAMVKALVRARQDVGAGPEIKVAVHTSQMLVGQGPVASELDLDGRQASLQALAALIDRGAADAVTVSDATAPFLTRGFEFEELEEDAVAYGRAFALVGHGRTGPGQGGGASPFVGRHREIEFLSSRLESSMRGQGQIVGISGEAGIGKSRLTYEFRESLTGKPVTCLEGLCHSYGASIPYLPVLDVLRASCGITDDDSLGAMADKARTNLLEAGMDLLETAPFLLHLLDIEPDSERFATLASDVAKARIFDILRQLVLKKSRRTPLVLVIEDLHWIDRTSEEFLASLAETVPGARLMLVCTYRDGYRPPWMDKSYATQVALQPLAPEESLRILRSVLGTERSRDELDAVIVVKAEGNPLFVEELARTVREQAGLVTPMAVPDTIEDVLGGRIDRLAAEDRRLLEVAAVVGKDVQFSIVHAVAGMPTDALRRTFERLKSAEFLYETSLGPEAEYTFKHTLTHEVAYGRLLASQRRALHAQIADAIERRSPERVSDNVERLAHHAFEGGAWEKAHGYLHQAGTKAFLRCAHREAAVCYERALAALDHMPAAREKTIRAIDLQLNLRSALQPLGEFGRILETLGNAEALARSLGDQPRLGRVVSFLADYSCRMGDHDRALEYGRQALAIAEPLDDLSLRLRSNLYLGQIHYARGDYRTAISFLEWNVAALEGGREREFLGHSQLPSVHARTNLAWCYAELGEFEAAARRGQEGILIAESVDHPYTLANACAGIGSAYARRGDLAAAIPVLERGLELCRSWTLSLWFPRVATSLGEAFVLAGRADEALTLLEQAERQSQMMRVVRGRGPLLTCLAGAYLAAGRRDNAIENARGARELARQHGESGHEAWALRLEGEIALQSDPGELTAAGERLQEALARANDLEMRPLAAHCRAALGRLHLRAGERDDARRHLTGAATLFRELGMTFWLDEVEATLAGLR
jgi:tetratricopeptide (TPR) repeat protein